MFADSECKSVLSTGPLLLPYPLVLSSFYHNLQSSKATFYFLFSEKFCSRKITRQSRVWREIVSETFCVDDWLYFFV